ncbi:MAG: sigma-70 family RNA polymerase sigma factor [Prevotella sp.]|jgi:RNA polymerase primary sigma factor|nr:sigma-70 family RNA polymerase sigma factor [Prevotella sp.]MCI1684220.1 sigma-70 family RNA polymerase sigma factor [Prevotella sp.]MCI1780469.1 sigma-70 family RNA polymerase sigma factor [Prevotella sp.]MCI1803637.1 sigma-70 family RNA polymerase sigma factor [Prevotella sp.]MCI1817026.1 sigma-70 family RNA polymerase sigma factor [Prevotella sp.]MCI1847904.1 sigma-70 family RNA polymerase sigma factor [Prevotella sp.]
MNDQKTIQKLINDNQGYVHSLALNYLNQGLDLEDLVGEGNMGMIKAAQTFDSSKSKRFVNYASGFIKGSIEKALKSYGLKATRSLDEKVPRGSQISTMRLQHVLEDKNTPRTDERLQADADSDDVRKLLSVLDDRERIVIRSLYGIGEDRLTMAQTGEKNGWKRERVRQIRDKALKKLSKASALLPIL